MRAGGSITVGLTKAPGDYTGIGGLKVTTENGWLAARPSGAKSICEIYAESFRGERHLEAIVAEAMGVADAAPEHSRRGRP